MGRKHNRWIFVDMDGTLARFRYVSREKLYEKGYFLKLEPVQAVSDAVLRLRRDGENVCVLSCYLEDSFFAKEEKERWMRKHMPGIPYVLIPCGSSKAVAAEKRIGRKLNRKDILIDDYTVNLLDWKMSGGTGLKLLNGMNDTHMSWDGARICEHSCYEDIKKNITA